MTRTTTIQLGDLRLPAQGRAKADGTSVSEVVRRALAAYLHVPYPERHDLGAMVRASLASRAIPQVEPDVKGESETTESAQIAADQEVARVLMLADGEVIIRELSYTGGLSAARLQELTGIDPISCEVALVDLLTSGKVSRDKTGAYVLVLTPVEIG